MLSYEIFIWKNVRYFATCVTFDWAWQVRLPVYTIYYDSIICDEKFFCLALPLSDTFHLTLLICIVSNIDFFIQS